MKEFGNLVTSNVSHAFKLQWQERVSDYVTAIAWTPDGSRLAVCTGSGEVVLFDGTMGTTTRLLEKQGKSLNTLSFSSEGQFLAVGGQEGIVTLWKIDGESPMLLTQLSYPRQWIDRLQWHPHQPELAISVGRQVQIWHARTPKTVTSLNFATSSVLDLAWHPQGTDLAVAGNQSIKIWHRQAWNSDPDLYEVGGASEAIAWSLDGTYLASGNNDCSLLVWEWGSPFPWRMQGFPGKVRQLAWSRLPSQNDAPILASLSGGEIFTWTKDVNPSVGWKAQALELGDETATAIAFQPASLLLASASKEGRIRLWKKTKQMTQYLQGTPQGFSSLAWNPQGTMLAAGGSQGGVWVWKQHARGKGFG